jgi:hypothetical protein
VYNKLSSVRNSINARAKTLTDVKNILEYLDNVPSSYENILCNMDEKSVLQIYDLAIDELRRTKDSSSLILISVPDMKKSMVIRIIRVAISGKQSSLPLSDLVNAFSVGELIERFENAKKFVKENIYDKL